MTGCCSERAAYASLDSNLDRVVVVVVVVVEVVVLVVVVEAVVLVVVALVVVVEVVVLVVKGHISYIVWLTANSIMYAYIY